MTDRPLEASQRYEDRPNIFISSFFRSGSTHVKVTLARLLGYRPTSTVMSVGALGNDSHQINHAAAQILFPMPAQVFHQHTLGTCGTATLLDLYKLKPVVMIRNVLDSMFSLRELLDSGEDQHLGIYYPPWFGDMEVEEQFEWLARNVTNWYCVFYLSWMQAEKLDILWIRYDDYYKDQIAGVRSILKHTGVDKLGYVSDDVIETFTKPYPGGRLNVGKSGRGKQIPWTCKQMIRDQMMSWGKKWGPRMIEELVEK